MENDLDHLRKIKAGNSSSFEYLYNLWSGKLYNFIMKISKGDRYLAEEIVQSAFIKIWENRESLDPDKSFSSYLFTIAKNLLINIYQRRLLESLHLEKVKEDIFADNTTDKDLDYKLLDEYVNSLVELLPPARKEIYILSRRNNLSNSEIAERLSLSENTIESQLRKATLFLRDKISKHYNIPLIILFFIFTY